jgi:hypothetical protein
MNRLSAALVSASLLAGALSACTTGKPSAVTSDRSERSERGLATSEASHHEPLSQADWTFVTQAHAAAPATTLWPDASVLSAGHAICAQTKSPQMQTPAGPDLVREYALTAETYHLDNQSATILVEVAMGYCY